MKAINPATGELIQNYNPHSWDDVESIISEVDKAAAGWSLKKIEERCHLVRKVGEALIEQKTELGKIITLEMGKPLRESIAEIEKCASGCFYYAENAPGFLQNEEIPIDGQKSIISFRPLGAILAVMPWNFPFWQAFRFAAPALCAGNTVVLKHASNVPGCAMAIEKIFTSAGLPENVFRSVLVSSDQVEKIIKHPKIKAVTLTGSTGAGKAVARAAGEALKKTVLELGGSDAYIILEDADLDHAAKVLVKGRMMNAGQSCISPKRIIAVTEVYKKLEEKILSEIQRILFGDPLDEKNQMGTMARDDLRNELHEQVKESIKKGAQCLAGGELPSGPGSFYPPTFLSGVRPGMPAFDEELFGPVFCLIEASDEAHALELANQSPYGLGGGIFSQNLEHATRLAQDHFDSGGCFINDFLKSDPRLPFGGIKQSGYGRELAFFGIREFVNIKTIVVKQSL